MSELIKKYRRFQLSQHAKRVERFRIRNQRRVLKGKAPVTAGWSKMIHSGVGIANQGRKIDRVGFLISEQQRIAQEKTNRIK